MIKKDKDFFEMVLSDVNPLEKSKKKKFLEKPKLKKESYFGKKLNLIKNHNEKNNINKKITSNKKNDNKKIAENNINFLKKLKQGKIRIQKKIDFHGCSLIKAETIFDNTISSCFNSNTRCILFITGKGNKRESQERDNKKLFYGKIRLSIKNWALKISNQKKILYFSEALIKHGGAGSFYVYLRKNN